MDCGQDWNRVSGDIYSSKDLGSLRDAGKSVGQSLWRQVTQLQVHMIPIWTTPSRIIKKHHTHVIEMHAGIRGKDTIEWLSSNKQQMVAKRDRAAPPTGISILHKFIYVSPALSDLQCHGA